MTAAAHPQGRALVLVRDDQPGPLHEAAPTVYVIQNHGLRDTPRLVVLGGDPRAPFAERPGIAVLEFYAGAWSPEERLEVIHFLEAKAAAKWEVAQRLEAQIEVFMRREQLQLAPSPRRRGGRARRDGGAA